MAYHAGTMVKGRAGLGRRGETLAAQALTSSGFTVVDRNWRCPIGEVDLVARRGDDIYFVEVRTRRTDAATSPELSLTPRKASRMEAVARAFLGSHPAGDDPIWHLSFVAVAMDGSGRLQRITLYPDLQGKPMDLLGLAAAGSAGSAPA